MTLALTHPVARGDGDPTPGIVFDPPLVVEFKLEHFLGLNPFERAQVHAWCSNQAPDVAVLGVDFFAGHQWCRVHYIESVEDEGTDEPKINAGQRYSYMKAPFPLTFAG